MRIQRKLMNSSVIIFIISFTLAICLEYRLLNNDYNIVFFIGHRNFFVNCLIGIVSSSILTFAISIVSYFAEKYKLLKEYYKLIHELFIVRNYFINLLFSYSKDGGLSVSDDKLYTIDDNLKKLENTLNSAKFIGNEYSPIIFYKKKSKLINKFIKDDSLIITQYYYNSACFEAYYAALETSAMYSLNILKTEKSPDNIQVSVSLQKLLNCLEKLEEERTKFSPAIEKHLFSKK